MGVIKKDMDSNRTYKQFLMALTQEVKDNWYKKTSKLADLASISQGNLSKILNEKIETTLDTQYRLAKACGYEYTDFLAKGEFLLTGKKVIKSTESPPVGNIIRVYNNILERTGLELDEEGQEKLFNLIKRRLSEKTAEAAEKEITEIISLTDKRKKG